MAAVGLVKDDGSKDEDDSRFDALLNDVDDLISSSPTKAEAPAGHAPSPGGLVGVGRTVERTPANVTAAGPDASLETLPLDLLEGENAALRAEVNSCTSLSPIPPSHPIPRHPP